MSKTKKFIIVDGNAIVHRSFHALPPMTSKNGQMVNAVYGFVTTLFKAIKEFKPEYLAVTFDRKEKTFRHDVYKDYKANRVKQVDELYDQIPVIQDVLKVLNVKTYDKAGFEADDLIGTLCEHNQVDRDDVKSIIVTGDMDALQLVDDNTSVYTLRKGMSDTVIYDEAGVKEKYQGLGPDQLIDYKGLRGDPSDNIPGVPGVGEKTAIGLIKEFGSMEEMYKKVEAKVYENIKVTPRIYGLLIDNKEQAILSKELATIVRDVKMDFKLEDAKVQGYDKDEVFKLFQELEFKSLLNRLPDLAERGTQNAEPPSEIKEQKKNHNYKYIQDKKEFDKFFAELEKQEQFVFDTETTGLNVFTDKLLGISFCWKDGEAYYLDAKKSFVDKLKPVFANEKIKKIAHNMKFDVKFLMMNGIEVRGIYFDTMIASYLLNPGTRTHKLDDITFREFGFQMTKLVDIAEKKQGQLFMDDVDPNKLADYSCEDADYTWRLVSVLKKELEKNKMMDLFNNIEMPLVDVLIEMELNGVKLNTDHLSALSRKLGAKIDKLTKKIHELAGEEFNISSPKQLQVILFEKLELSTFGLNKTKTGYSTAAGELNKLKEQHEIVPLVEEYRELTKLKSTYIDALPKLIEPKTGRVHTEFNQTITATGRLSSSNPNLQNIPIRSDFGREIRRAFIAEPGKKIVAADYSQIELRVVACLANDKTMIDGFNRGDDIHSVTAAKVYGVELKDVTKEMRSGAKEVNFGVLYGMGAWGLAERKGISRAEAKDFIDKYFENFSSVKTYLDQMKETARDQGYVETLFGRRRYLPEINSGVQQVKASAERMAINMPVQGTGADLMKIAMIRVYSRLKENTNDTNGHTNSCDTNKQVKLLLQVHDEIVIEVPDGMVDEVGKMVRSEMQNVYKMCVPIDVDVEVGENWQEMK
ncbi:DNA polymerase I [Candidatus Falkowbacteria bacterium]|nr:DNA polymerase I [Candidatus Falkowbacteria bacterium]